VTRENRDVHLTNISPTNLPIFVSAQIIGLYCRCVVHVRGHDMHCAAAAGPEVAYARCDGVEGVQRLAERWQRQRLHMPFNVGVGMIRAAAGKAAEGGRRHRHRSSPLQGKLHAHHDACERVPIEAVHCAAMGVLGRGQDWNAEGNWSSVYAHLQPCTLYTVRSCR
jgi:hypothetical protein